MPYQKQQVFEQAREIFRREWGINLTLADQVRLRSEYVPRAIIDAEFYDKIGDPYDELNTAKEAVLRYIHDFYGINPTQEILWSGLPCVKYAQHLDEKFHLL